MLNAFIYAGLRTPFGRHAGALAPVRPDAEFTIRLDPESAPAQGLRFEVRCGDTVAASGRWEPGLRE